MSRFFKPLLALIFVCLAHSTYASESENNSIWDIKLPWDIQWEVDIDLFAQWDDTGSLTLLAEELAVNFLKEIKATDDGNLVVVLAAGANFAIPFNKGIIEGADFSNDDFFDNTYVRIEHKDSSLGCSIYAQGGKTDVTARPSMSNLKPLKNLKGTSPESRVEAQVPMVSAGIGSCEGPLKIFRRPEINFLQKRGGFSQTAQAPL